MILFLDDERDFRTVCSVRYRDRLNLPPFTDEQMELIRTYSRNVWTVRSFIEAQRVIRELNRDEPDFVFMPDLIFFDNDLGTADEGQDLLKWILNHSPCRFDAYFHTANPIARENMQSMFNSYRKAVWHV